VSPILVRPIREQFEHDRVIRVLQARYKRKFEVAINPGAEQNASVTVGELTLYPDVVLFGQDRGRKVQGTIEVETTESINTLEAMAEWAQFGRLRVPFMLYVPPNSVDTAKRLCTEHQVTVAEIWTYHTAVDQVRFTMVHRAPDAPVVRARAPQTAEKKPAPAKPVPVKAGAKSNSPKKASKPAAAKKAAPNKGLRLAPARSGQASRAAAARSGQASRAVSRSGRAARAVTPRTGHAKAAKRR
jgi:hypothetical protein